MADRAKQERDSILDSLKSVTRALTTYTARPSPNSRQLRNRIDAVVTAITTLHERQTKFRSVAVDIEADQELLTPILDAAENAVDDVEEKIDQLDAPGMPTQAVQT